MIGLKDRASPQSGTLVDRVIADLENTATRMNDLMNEQAKLRNELMDEAKALREWGKRIRSDVAAVTVEK